MRAGSFRCRSGTASLLGAAVLCLAGCDDTPGQWSAIVYPDARDRSSYQTTHRFKSFAMCRQAAKETIATLPDPAKATYECGFQCDSDPARPGKNLCRSVRAATRD